MGSCITFSGPSLRSHAVSLFYILLITKILTVKEGDADCTFEQEKCQVICSHNHFLLFFEYVPITSTFFFFFLPLGMCFSVWNVLFLFFVYLPSTIHPMRHAHPAKLPFPHHIVALVTFSATPHSKSTFLIIKFCASVSISRL